MIKKPIVTLFLFATLWKSCYSQVSKQVSSPDQKIKLSVEIDKEFRYSVQYQNSRILSPSQIDMILDDGKRLSDRLGKPKVSIRSVNEVIISPVPEKRRQVSDIYNEITFRFSNAFGVIFRVYNDGVAYRITTALKDSIIVQNEISDFNFPENSPVYFPEVAKRGGNQDKYHSSFEEPYQIKPLDSITNENLIFSPILVAPKSGPKIVITESDLEEYPGMFLTGKAAYGLSSEFAPYPKTEEVLKGEFSQVYVSKREDFIAKTKGERSFPWRVLLIAAEDKSLPENDLVYRLASPSRVSEVSWIQPRKSTEEWIISSNIFNVPFKSGINTDTYKYYIDFAKRFGFEQVLLDAGWSDNDDLFKIIPTLNINEVVSYAKSKGVKLGMWTLAMTLDRQLEPALDQFNSWGVDFIMTDFMDRDDQKTVNFYHRIAQACARHKIMLMFHGAFKPAGFNRTYPHALTREGVLGSEYNMWSAKATPEHNLLLPFIRMTSGPMDYEPGLLNNGTAKTFRPIQEGVMSFGTRTQQLAMFVVYDSPMQLFSGNPSQGFQEPEFMELLGGIPTTWDTTIVVDAKLGDYIVTARKKDDTWYIGAMNDLTARELSVSLDFLKDNAYEATICQDGENADHYASDYKITTNNLSNVKNYSIKMAAGGGFLMRIKKK